MATKMTKLIRYISCLLLILGLATPAAAKRSTLNLKGLPSSGLNAFDYKLQKPLGNDTFPAGQKGFSNNFFLGLGATLLDQTQTFTPERVGGNINLRLGGWFTPVHGIRLSAATGLNSFMGYDGSTSYTGGQLDYLVNLTSLLRGYDPNRSFELIGAMGLEGGIMRHQGKNAGQYGVGASLQMRFNCAQSLYLFIEPRIAMLGGSKLGFNSYDAYRMKTQPSLSVGLGYRLLKGQARKAGSTEFFQTKEDNLYFGAEGGLWVPTKETSTVGQGGTAYFGKWLSASSALQLTANLGHHCGDCVNIGHRIYTIGTVNYVLNLTNAFSGYRPNHVFDLLANVGVGAGHVLVKHTDIEKKIAPVATIGVTGAFNVSPNWAITIHPQAYFSNQNFFNPLQVRRSTLFTADLGLRYTMGNFTRNHYGDRQELKSAKRWFASFGAGFGHRLRHEYGNGFNVYVGAGRRVTPISAFRVLIDVNHFAHDAGSTNFCLDVDYLSSITTAMYGLNDNRLFDLQFVLGVYGGGAKNGETFNGILGGKTGLIGNFRINDSFKVFVEPLVIAAWQPEGKAHTIIPGVRANVGVTYAF